jgi:hypothetical protein
MRRTEESIEEGYKRPRCTRLRDDLYFHDLVDLDECDCVINKKTGEICGVPKYCHFSLQPLCRLTQEIINSDKDEYITTNNFCIACLQKKFCCLASDHPHGDISATSAATMSPIQTSKYIDGPYTKKEDL